MGKERLGEKRKEVTAALYVSVGKKKKEERSTLKVQASAREKEDGCWVDTLCCFRRRKKKGGMSKNRVSRERRVEEEW